MQPLNIKPFYAAAHGGKFYFQNWEQGSSIKLCIPSYKK